MTTLLDRLFAWLYLRQFQEMKREIMSAINDQISSLGDKLTADNAETKASLDALTAAIAAQSIPVDQATLDKLTVAVADAGANKDAIAALLATLVPPPAPEPPAEPRPTE